MREDLIALTPESVATLSNLGLVKRALREIEQGKGPQLVEEADGTVIGTFEDGVVARLIRGRLLKECPCTCAAAGACRHRVATALAYKTFADASGAPSIEVWSPGTFTEADVEAALGRRTLDEARSAGRRGVLVEIVRATAKEVPTARLPACTVRFLVPRDLVYARCDCAVGQRCAHVALATWAFQRADELDPRAPTLTVDVRLGLAREADDDAPEALALGLALDVVADGVTNAREALAQRFVLARDPLERAGQRWLVTALEDLEQTLGRYRARSARYRTADVLGLAAEIVARPRAARAESALPASAILGRGEAMETKLDHVRLVGLGCRFDADDQERSVEILFADPDTATVLVMEKSWVFPVGEAMPEGPALARRKLGAGTVGALAAGQLVTRVARRRANRVLLLGAGGQGTSSVTPQTGDFTALPKPLRIDGIAELEAIAAARPPRLLRPRVRAADVHAIAVGAVEDVVFDAAEQRVIARLRDPAGATFLVRRGHRRVAPGALDELARALLGTHGPVRWVVGTITREHGNVVVDPTLVAADRVIVPDIEDGGPMQLPKGRIPTPESRVDAALRGAEQLLEEIVQLGVVGITSTFEPRGAAAISALREIGLGSLARRVGVAVEATLAARKDPSDTTKRTAAGAVVDCAIRLELAREASVG